MENNLHLEQARQLMDAFANRTGLNDAQGDPARRYLWTDAFAVQAFFGLSHALGEEKYRQEALQLIELVHEHLGKFHPQDNREGWISGLDESSGNARPTAAGLRIGKKLPERQKDESYNSRLEWERDGQYFHYLSRWMNALLQAHKETKDKKYLLYARDLFLATEKFIYGSGNGLAMYWKMDTQLSGPLVPSIGAQDPLEGLLCGLSLKNVIFEEDKEVDALIDKFRTICRGKNWDTTDPLGIGGLLLSAVRAGQMENSGMRLPASVKSEKLLKESVKSLKGLYGFGKDENPNRRLAFRECGLSLGLRVAKASKNAIIDTSASEGLTDYFYLASEIEEFWLNSENRQAATWNDHLDINAVSLASSLIASEVPETFSAA
jgi:hypothetical protein